MSQNRKSFYLGRVLFSSLLLTGLSFISNEKVAIQEQCPTPSWRNVAAATHFARHFGFWFVVDHWHQRVIFNRTLDPCLSRWKELPGRLNGPHSIASDGKVLVVDSTDDNSVFIYTPKAKFGWTLSQVISNLWQRPHRVIFDRRISSFLVIAANDQTIVQIGRSYSGYSEVTRWKLLLPASDLHHYCRSISTYRAGYLAVCNNSLNYFTVNSAGLRIISRIKLSEDWYELNDVLVLPSNARFLVTSTRGKFEYIRRLTQLKNQNLEPIQDLTELFAIKARPYYLSLVGTRLLVTEFFDYNRLLIAEISSISPFEINAAQVVVDSGSRNNVNWERWNRTCHSCWEV